MKVLITGNMGYIGPVLTEYLKANHKEIIIDGFDTGFFATSLLNKEVFPEKNINKQIFGDVRYLDLYNIENYDAIIYLSAISNDPMGNVYEKVTEEINYKQAIEFAKKAKYSGVKNFIFASSCSIYGYAEEESKVENSSLNPLTAYAKSKVNAEKDLEKISDDNFIVTCLRFATACGMSPRLRLDLVLNDFVTSALVNKEINILSDGKPWRPLIHVKDMSRAINWAIKRELKNGGKFIAVNTGSNNWNYQVSDLAEATGEIIKGISIKINKDAQPDKRSYKVNFDYFNSLAPEFQPQISLKDAISDLLNGLESNNFNNKDFRNSEYIRLNKLNNLKQMGYLDLNLNWKR